MTYRIDRRGLIGGAAALGAGLAMPSIVRAQSQTLVAATFPGTWNEADRNVISPAFKAATGAAVTQSIVLGTDQVARLTAAKGNRPPFDVAFFDAPQVIDAVRDGLIVEYPMASLMARPQATIRTLAAIAILLAVIVTVLFCKLATPISGLLATTDVVVSTHFLDASAVR